MKDLEDLEVEKRKLVDRGATGISIFVKNSNDISVRDYALDMVKCMKLMTRENTRPMNDL